MSKYSIYLKDRLLTEETSREQQQNCSLYYNLLFFTWDVGVDDAANNQTVYQRYQYDVHLFQGQTFTVNHLVIVKLSQGLYLIYKNIHLSHKWWYLKFTVEDKKIKRSFILEPLSYKWVSLFQHLLDCFSTREQAFIETASSSSVFFVRWFLFLTIF